MMGLFVLLHMIMLTAGVCKHCRLAACQILIIRIDTGRTSNCLGTNYYSAVASKEMVHKTSTDKFLPYSNKVLDTVLFPNIRVEFASTLWIFLCNEFWIGQFKIIMKDWWWFLLFWDPSGCYRNDQRQSAKRPAVLCVVHSRLGATNKVAWGITYDYPHSVIFPEISQRDVVHCNIWMNSSLW